MKESKEIRLGDRRLPFRVIRIDELSVMDPFVSNHLGLALKQTRKENKFSSKRRSASMRL